MPEKKKSRLLLILLDIVLWLLLVWFDLWTKSLAEAALKGKPAYPLIPHVLEFYYLENHGAAFSMLQNATVFFYIVAGVAITAIALILLRIPMEKKYMPLHFLLLFVSAGAAGNLVDRIQLHYVRDFIYFSLIDFPVFNVADIYVTCSTFLLVILVLFRYKDEDFAFLQSKKEAEKEADAKEEGPQDECR